MSILLVGYDLNRPGQDYSDLIKVLKAEGTWWHGLDSTWLIRTTKTPKEMRDAITPHVDTNDEVLVIDVTGCAAAWRGFPKDESDWILEQL